MKNENDLSDEAFYEFVKTRDCEYTLDIWRECRRRAQVQIKKLEEMLKKEQGKNDPTA